MSKQRMPVILDVDTGYDDALAIILALRSPKLHVQGVTCVSGNHTLKQVLENTLTLLEVMGVSSVPVAAGMQRPLLEDLRPPALLHGRDGMADLGLPRPRLQPVDVHAVQLLRQLLTNAPQPVTLIALAPLTNIAVFLRMYPELKPKIREITVMGGTYAAPGNTSPLAEFNMRQDPEAAAIVLESGLPILLYPVDVFRQLHLNRPDINRLLASKEAAAQTAGRILLYVCNYLQKDTALIGDAGAVASVIDPSGIACERYPVTIELRGAATRGQTVLDRRSPSQRDRLTEWWQSSPAEINVVTAMDVAHYKNLFIQTLSASAQSGLT